MCGIFGLVRGSRTAAASTRPLLAATHLVRHRGPDDEGYLLWSRGHSAVVYAGPDTAPTSRDARRLTSLPESAAWQVAFGHRRLSIVDLTWAGHQPMVHSPTGLALVFNGEIYNHQELRRVLEGLGHRFESHCDTEVLLAAWAEWGPACLDRFNGMFAFLLLDPRGGGTLHAVRDRFGVKPLYWARVGDAIAFASEIKQIRALPGFVPSIDHAALRDFLVTGLLDHGAHTLDLGVAQLKGGERAEVRLDAGEPTVRTVQWYTLRPTPFRGAAADAAATFRALLTDSVQLRLRADVPVGSCLSGGLDSSAIVCLAHRELTGRESHAGQVTVTARFDSARHDEWRFAEEVVRQTGATSVEVWPSVDGLLRELDRQLWHMDEPFGSTSVFSQWCVFRGAADAGLTVMLDGQGSDEQLAGYGGAEGALYAGMLRRGELPSLASELAAARRRHGSLPVAQLVLAARNAAPWIDPLLPARVRAAPERAAWLRGDGYSHASARAPRDLAEHLQRQLLATSLPALLHYEDRNSMAWSIEARVPFLDYRLVEFTAGLPDALKLHRGMTKAVMREAMRGVLPEAVRNRRDKMGFVTPEEIWLTRTASDWFRDGVRAAVDAAPELFHADRVLSLVEGMIGGRVPFSFLPWRILCVGRWLAMVRGGAATDAPAAAVHGRP